ncbi:MAG TPA: glycerol kinase [Bacteroidetes bacterium]|nr:glycerol kinase [Bacteroidota bacterium]
MKGKYILALDQGTTSSRAVLFDREGGLAGMAQREFPQFYPRPGWVEQDPLDILNSQLEAVKELMTHTGIDRTRIEAIGITNQRETAVVWEKETGLPVYPALVWQDKRTSAFMNQFRRNEIERSFREKTGLVADTYFSASKVYWILDHNPQLREKARAGKLLFGTVDSWLIWKLTGRKVHATDLTNASRTLLFNINTLEWDDDMMELFGVPGVMMPEVKPSAGEYGRVSADFPFLQGIPVTGVAGDQQAALLGQGCLDPGMVKNTYGTGCFLLMNTGTRPVFSRSGLLTTIAWGIGNQVYYAMEGSIFIAGAAIQWLRDSLGIIAAASESDPISREAGETGDLFVVPAFSGLGAPYWDMNARGGILGISHSTDRKKIVRATLESLAYQTRDVILAMENDSDVPVLQLKVDGGASANNFLMQFQADILGKEVHRPENIEATAMGAAILAGLGSGFWNMNEIRQFHSAVTVFTPEMPSSVREKKYCKWLKAVERVKAWAEEEES